MLRRIKLEDLKSKLRGLIKKSSFMSEVLNKELSNKYIESFAQYTIEQANSLCKEIDDLMEMEDDQINENEKEINTIKALIYSVEEMQNEIMDYIIKK